jgi:hypothetical protein
MLHRIVIVGAIVAAAGSAGAAPARKAPAAVTITNARAVAATDVTVRAGQDTVALTRPLAPGSKAALKLPKMRDCLVAVSASFEDETVAEVEAFDVCREKTIRFTD